MHEGDFKEQYVGFINNEPEIIDRAVEARKLFHADPNSFFVSLTENLSPTRLCAIAEIALLENDRELAINLMNTAQTARALAKEKLPLISDAARRDEVFDDVENYGHVISLLEPIVNGESDTGVKKIDLGVKATAASGVSALDELPARTGEIPAPLTDRP